MNVQNMSQNTVKIVVLAVAIIATSVITSRFFFRIDVTEDNAYTLSEGSLTIAEKLTDEVNAKLYFSRSVKDMPVLIKQYGTRVEEVLREYVAASGGKLTLDVIDPRPDTDDEEWANKYGVQGVGLGSGESLYLGVVFLAADKEIAIPYLDPRKEEFLEYDLSEALVKLRAGSKPKLGLLSSLKLSSPGAQMPGMPPQGEDWAIVSSLKNTFDVVNLETTAESITDDISVLLVIHPKDLQDKTLFAIDQFVMRGGRLFVAVDPFSRTDLAANHQAMGMGRMPQASSQLDKLFKAWDIEYKSGDVVGDLGRGTQISAGGQRLIYPLFMTMMPEDLARDSQITAQLKQILYAEGGSFSLKNGSPHKFEPLLSTSNDAGTTQGMMLSFQQPADVAARFKSAGKKHTLAARIQGKFKSAFPSGVEGQTGLTEAKEDNVIIVIGDVDFMHDNNSVNKIRFGPQILMSPKNDNLNFVLNSVELLGGNKDLISIRSSGQISRPFTKVLEIQKAAQARWQTEEDKLSKELTALQEKLANLQNQRTDGNRLSLNASQQAEIKKFREEERLIRKRRRMVRKNLREDIENLGHKLVAANLLITPLGVAGFGVLVFRKRSRREREEKKNG